MLIAWFLSDFLLIISDCCGGSVAEYNIDALHVCASSAPPEGATDTLFISFESRELYLLPEKLEKTTSSVYVCVAVGVCVCCRIIITF